MGEGGQSDENLILGKLHATRFTPATNEKTGKVRKFSARAARSEKRAATTGSATPWPRPATLSSHEVFGKYY